MRKPKMQPPAMLARAICILILVGMSLDGTFLWAVTPLKTIPVGHSPGPIAVDPAAHFAYVVNQGANTVSVIDTLQLKVKKVIPVGTSPVAIAANPPAGMVYVANSSSGTISMISGTKAAVLWPVGGKPFALVVDSALNQLYVADASTNQITILDATVGKVLAIIPTTLQPTALALNVATHALFVACTGASGSVVVIDGTHNQLVTTVSSLPAGTTSISIDPATNVAVLVSPTANIYTVVNAASGYSVLEEPGDTGADPIATAFDPGGGVFFMADTGDGNIFFALGDGIVTLGNDYQTHFSGAAALAVNPTTNQMGVVYPAGFAEIIDLLNPLFPQVYHEVTTGANPTALAFDPLTNRAFFTNTSDNTVTVVDITPGTAVAAYEGKFDGNGPTMNFIDANPATGTTYTLHLGNIYAINEAQAGAGSTGSGGNTAGVTPVPLASIYSECVAVNSATNKIYAGDSQGFFYSVNGATNAATLVSSVPATANIGSIAVDSATNQILALDFQGNNLFVLDSSTDSLVKTIPLTTSELLSVLVDPAKNLAYVVGNSVLVVDPTAGAVVASLLLSKQPIYAALNAAGSRLYVISNTGDLFVIDTTNSTITTTFQVQFYPLSIGVNPLTGNYYVGENDGGTGTPHVFVYSGSSNKLLSDLSRAVYPQITGAVNITVNPLTNQVYVGSDSGNSSSIVAVIDGLTTAVSALPSSGFDSAAHALSLNLGTGLLAGAGTDYTTLWFPTSDVSGASEVPIAVGTQGVSDSQTIATVPIFRTHNTKPKFTVSATSTLVQNAAAMVPQHGFYQVDGWQGTWKAIKLTAKNGSLTATGKVTLPALATGRHILYVYATDGDIATDQSTATGANSPVISSIGSSVFTVEK